MKKTSYVQQIISKNHSYNEQGITLVALIVTIIVLLILSGITIASFKQSNIITKAKDSAKRYSASQIDEKIDVAQQNLVVERQGYDYSIKDLVDEVKKENKDIDTIFVDESNNGRKATYIIDDYFYDFTKNDDGIIVNNRKADASDKDKEKYENKIELKDLKSGIITFKNDKTDWTNENVNVTIGAKTDDKSIQEKIDNGTYFVVSTVNDATKLTTLTKKITNQVATNQGDTIYACLTDGYGTYVATATEKIENIDKTKPTDTKPIAKTTTNSITATNTQEDKPGATEVKASGIKTTQYQIKKNEDTTWGTLQSSGTFTGLTQNIKYDVRTQVTDNAGNKTTSQITTVTTGTINAVGKATASPTGWTNKDVTVTLPKADGFTTMYTTNGTIPTATASSTTKAYSSPFTVSTNCTVLYVYTDGTNINSAGTLGIDNIDKTAPTNTAPTETHTTNSITVTCKQADNAGTNEKASGIAKTEYSKDGGKTWQASNVFSGLKQNAAYTIKTRVTDKAGNVTESQTLSVTTGTISAVGTASATPTTLTSGDVTVTLPTLTGFTTKYTTNGTAPSTSSTTYTGPFTVSSNCTVLYVYTDGTNINSAGTLGITNIDKTNYTISYNLNGGSASGNPTSYKVDTETITINNPTKTGHTFLGWTGSNDLSSGLENYTSSSQYVASSRDHVLGNEFNVIAGEKYRVFVKGTRTRGSLNLQGGISYTSQTSGNSWDGYDGEFTNLGGELYYKEITIPSGKTKGRFYIQLDQDWQGGETSWNLYDMHVIKVENPTIPTGSQGNKSFTANWIANQYSVKCEDWFVDSSNNRKVKIQDTGTKSYNYGATAKGSDWGTGNNESWRYHTCTQATVGTSGVIVYRYYYVWVDVNILNPSGVQDYASARFSLSNDGSNWDTGLTNESSKSDNLPYGTVLRIKDLSPYYKYYYYSSCSGCNYSNGQWTYTVTGPNSMVIKMQQYGDLVIFDNGLKSGYTSYTKKNEPTGWNDSYSRLDVGSYIYFNGYSNKMLIFNTPISNRYKYLKINAKTNKISNFGSYYTSRFGIAGTTSSSSVIVTNDLSGYNIIDWTNSSRLTDYNNYTTFTLDISNVTNPQFYVYLHNCDTDFYISKIWLSNY